mmetsp:Transcript_16152/g.40535  ORF Transcript_16152/g.40535 Transcript_16152/m.40535 type:complete len:112 (-) Transcript_16152:227-562(-)
MGACKDVLTITCHVYPNFLVWVRSGVSIGVPASWPSAPNLLLMCGGGGGGDAHSRAAASVADTLAILQRSRRAGGGGGQGEGAEEAAAAEWKPPEGQTGDGRTALNDKLGY